MDETTVENKKNNTPLIIGAVAVIIVVIGIVAMRSGNSSSTQAPATQNDQTSQESAIPTTSDVSGSTGNTTASEGNVQTIAVEAGSYYFNPKEIRAKVGQTVRIELTSKDMMHNFYLDEFNVKGPTTKAGETSTVEFVASKAGEFEYYCNVGNHRKMGQVGKLIVEE